MKSFGLLAVAPFLASLAAAANSVCSLPRLICHLPLLSSYSKLSLISPSQAVLISNSPSAYGNRFSVEITNVDDLLSPSGDVLAQAISQKTNEYILNSEIIDAISSVADSQLILDPDTVQSISYISYIAPASPALVAHSSSLERSSGSSFQISLSFTPQSIDNGAKSSNAAILLHSGQDSAPAFLANLAVSEDGYVVLKDSVNSEVPVKFESSANSVSDSCAKTSNKYWCAIRSLASGFQTNTRSIINNLSGVDLQEQRSSHKSSEKHSSHKSKSKSHHEEHSSDDHSARKSHRSQRHSSGRNESAASLFNALTHSLFSFTLPLLIGILTGSAVVMACVWLSDLISNAFLRFRYGRVPDYEYIVVVNPSGERREFREKSYHDLPDEAYDVSQLPPYSDVEPESTQVSADAPSS
ncbi:hypothetical protein BZA70DRAFT_285553 [Myxozyma melibiosi]|uniref:Protein BIG1 n=1 Tax=Myxozyma melibiosi TaxID=54550 RepID=A0ABR1EYI6_9ASCO